MENEIAMCYGAILTVVIVAVLATLIFLLHARSGTQFEDTNNQYVQQMGYWITDDEEDNEPEYRTI